MATKNIYFKELLYSIVENVGFFVQTGHRHFIKVPLSQTWTANFLAVNKCNPRLPNVWPIDAEDSFHVFF